MAQLLEVSPRQSASGAGYNLDVVRQEDPVDAIECGALALLQAKGEVALQNVLHDGLFVGVDLLVVWLCAVTTIEASHSMHVTSVTSSSPSGPEQGEAMV